MASEFNAAGGEHWFRQVQEWEQTRYKELTTMYQPMLEVTEAYAKLVCRVVQVVGQTRPASVQDKVVSDLMADVFDMLRQSERIIMEGKTMLAYPTARRAYESLSLMVLCILDKKYAEKWEKGVQISNGEVRTQLAKHKFGETKKSTDDLYNRFSEAAHPNRNTIACRFLGDGNPFNLGVLIAPDLIVTTDYCISNVELWFWFVAVLAYHYRHSMDKLDKSFGRDYLKTANAAKEINQQLNSEFNRLLAEYKASKAKPNP